MLEIETVDYAFLNNYKKLSDYTTKMGTRIKILHNNQHRIDTTSIESSRWDSNNLFVFLNTSIDTCSERLETLKYICSEFINTRDKSLIDNKKFRIIISTHTSEINYCFNIEQILNDDVFRMINNTKFMQIKMNLKIRFAYTYRYFFKFSYIIMIKDNIETYVPANKNIFVSEELYEEYKEQQRSAKIALNCLKQNLSMNFMYYNDFFNFINYAYEDVIKLNFIKRPWSQLIEIKSINNYHNFINSLAIRIRDIYKENVDIKYLTGSFDFKKFRFIDLSNFYNLFEYFNFTDVSETLGNETNLNKIDSLVMYIELKIDNEIQRYYIAFMIQDQPFLQHLNFHYNYYADKCLKKNSASEIRNLEPSKVSKIKISNNPEDIAIQICLNKINFFCKNFLTYISTIKNQKLNHDVILNHAVDFSIRYVGAEGDVYIPGMSNFNLQMYKSEWLYDYDQIFQNEALECRDLAKKFIFNALKYSIFRQKVLDSFSIYLEDYSRSFEQHVKENPNTIIFCQIGDAYIDETFADELFRDLKC
ncbi:hypothetical protein COBT_000131 [Conglomerata obtusa]